MLEPFIFNSKLLWAIEQTREIYKQNQIRVQQIREIIEEKNTQSMFFLVFLDALASLRPIL